MGWVLDCVRGDVAAPRVQQIAHRMGQIVEAVRLGEQTKTGRGGWIAGASRGGKTGCEQNGRRGPQPGDQGRQFHAIQRARHHHVGEQQVDRPAGGDDPQRLFRVLRLDHPIAEFAELASGDLAQFRVVLHQQDRFIAADRHPWGRLGRRRQVRGTGARQPEPERRAAPGLAEDVDMAAGLLDEAEHHGEAKTAAGADLLRGEKRLEDAAKDFGRDAGSGVGDLDQHVLARRGFRL